MSTEDDSLILEIDGPDVHPHNVDTLKAAELAAAYFTMLVRVAREAGEVIELKGFETADKCHGMNARVSDSEVARRAIEKSSRYLTLVETPPEGLGAVVERARTAIHALPVEQTANVIVGPWPKLPLLAAVPEPLRPPPEWVQVRAKLIGLNALRPSAKFASEFEPRPFTIVIRKEQVRPLGLHIDRLMDIDVEVQRDETGLIRDGILDAFFAVDEDLDEYAAWKAWYDEHAKHWDEVDDIDAELRRV